jgi:uncharacterized protein
MAASGRVHDGFLPGRHAVTGFGEGGFRFAEMSHQGGILLLPSGVRRWDPPSPFRHEEALYDPVLAEAGLVDLLLVGAGGAPVPLPEPLRWRFRDAGIAVDVTTTASAASTYNVLLEEGRRIAAALAPVA